MNLSVAFAGLVAGVIVWALLVRSLTTKPWEAQDPASSNMGRTHGLAPARIGLLILLAVITSLFGLFISAYYMRMGHGHGEQGHGNWSSFPQPQILWLNTALLILGSVAMQWAQGAVRKDKRAQTAYGLIAGGLLTCLFLGGQLIAWRQVNAAGYASGFFGTSNPAIAFFYLLTAVHGLHLLGGLCVWAKTLVRLSEGVAIGALRLSVELCTVYWHYLLLVWLVLFALLLST